MDVCAFSDYSYPRSQENSNPTHPLTNENTGRKNTPSNCRLCLFEVQDGSGTALDGIVKDMLEIILPELNLSICLAPSICTSCLQTLKQSYSFKSCCLEAEDKVQEYASPHLFVDLKKVLKQSGVQEMKNQAVCRTCLSLKNETSLTRLCSYEGDPLQNMVEKCLPEVGLNITKDPMICSMCLEQLEEQFHFIMQCLDTEAKINFYSERKHIFSNIDLYNVCLFAVCMEEADEIDKYTERTEILNDCDNDRLKPLQEGLQCKQEKSSPEVIDLTDEYLNKLVKEKQDPHNIIEDQTESTESNEKSVADSVIEEKKEESDTDISVTDPNDLLEVRKVRKVRDISTYKKRSQKIIKADPPSYKTVAADDELESKRTPKKATDAS